MNVDEAIAVIDDIASKLAAIGLPVWSDALCESTSVIRTHLNRKVDDAMVQRAVDAFFDSSDYDMGYNGYIGSGAIRDALIAALGGDDEA